MINLTLDTLVLDNDEAEKRHGVEKGFQPLHLIWKNKIDEGGHGGAEV